MGYSRGRCPNRSLADSAGPLWVRRGGWGHLLNHHYLRAIELAQGGGSAAGPKTTTPEPFERYGGGTAAAPRLFGYINGGHGR